MSVLETPRIVFRGNIAWDPIVTNNYFGLYDENSAETVLPHADDTWAQVQAFRAEAIDAVPPDPKKANQRNWDPQGTHRSVFYDLAAPDSASPDSAITDSAVSGVDLGSGTTADDPFVGAPARFSGKLVDLEPYGSYSSQLFFDTMTFGIDGGCRIAAKRRTRVTARYINLGRNPVFYIAGFASIVWQTSFLIEDLIVDAFDSPALQALQSALGQPGVIGLTVRWVNYRTVYYDCPELATDIALRTTTAQALVAKLRLNDAAGNGVWQPNPARSKMVGVIGLWREGEPLHEPGDRALLATSFPTQGPANPPCVATAFARLDGDSLTLDLGSSMPETGLDLTKQNWGPLEVVALDSSKPGGSVSLATIGYDEDTDPGCQAYYARPYYEADSGIVSLKVDGSSFSPDAPLQVSCPTGILLTEAPFRAVPLVPNLYLDETDSAEGIFQIYVNGVPGGGGTEVTVYGLDANDAVVSGPTAVTAGPDGRFAVDLPASPASVVSHVPLIGAGQPAPSGGLNPQVDTYMYVRRLPADAAVAALDPTWDNVYTRVLANWNAMAPCMDNWLDLHDPDQVRASAPAIKYLTDPANLEAFSYMPVTRDMTAGERTLLYKFLDSPSPGAAVNLGSEGPANRPATDRIRISRYMRSP
ncbi:MAG TPA: hypothetical protein VGA98_00935 [Allosphingosinicella sp.]|jgi:hypothetical protein